MKFTEHQLTKPSSPKFNEPPRVSIGLFLLFLCGTCFSTASLGMSVHLWAATFVFSLGLTLEIIIISWKPYDRASYQVQQVNQILD